MDHTGRLLKVEFMKNSFYLLILLSVSLSGCAKFDLFIRSASVVPSFEIQTPLPGTRFVPSETYDVSGICDPLGGDVTLTGSGFTEVSVTVPCDPTTGTFTTEVTALPSGELLDITGEQNSESGDPLSDGVDTLYVHCAGPAMYTCAHTGSGNTSDPYEVGNISCLQEMRVGLGCHYVLQNDIDASDTANWNVEASVARGWEPVPRSSNTSVVFWGTLDGRGHTISNLFVTPRERNGSGMFSRISTTGSFKSTVRDITIDNSTIRVNDSNVESREHFSILAGIATDVELDDVSVLNSEVVSDINDTINGQSFSHGGLVLGIGRQVTANDIHVSGKLTFAFPELTSSNENYAEVHTVGGFAGLIEDSVSTGLRVNVTLGNDNQPNHGRWTVVGGAVGHSVQSQFIDTHTDGHLNLETLTRYKYGENYSWAVYKVGGVVGNTDHSSFETLCSNIKVDITTDGHNLMGVGAVAGRLGDYSGSTAENFSEVKVTGDYNVYAGTTGGVIGIVNSVAGLFGNDMTMHSSFRDILVSNQASIHGRRENEWTAAPGGLFSHVGGSGETATASVHRVLQLSEFEATGDFGPDIPGGLFQSANRHVGLNYISSLFYAQDLTATGNYPATSSDQGWNTPYGIVTGTSAGFSMAADSFFTNFDFVNVWDRSGPGGMPNLRACP